eukprot:scaffold268311_cov40-Tisochrysis_lutea.AAC.5
MLRRKSRFSPQRGDIVRETASCNPGKCRATIQSGIMGDWWKSSAGVAVCEQCSPPSRTLGRLTARCSNGQDGDIGRFGVGEKARWREEDAERG